MNFERRRTCVMGKRSHSMIGDRSGAVFPMAAIAMVVLAAMIGGGIDVSRAYVVQNRLQSACDAGVLAGRRAVGSSGFTTSARSRAETFFNNNFSAADEGVGSVTFTPTSDDDGNTIDGTASTTVDTVVMRLFGFETMPISVTCTASMSVGNSDVMMVLDTTGSMDWTIGGSITNNDSLRRITFLRAAMKDFYDTVASASAGSNARIRFGFVPYSSSVNVGHLLDSDWLVDSMAIQSREPEYETITQNVLIGYESPVYSTNSGATDISQSNWSNYNYSQYYSSYSCDNAKPDDTSWANYGGSSSDTDTNINAAGQRVTTTRTSRYQNRTAYRCRQLYNGRYRIQDRTEVREVFSEEVWTEDPIYQSQTSTQFKRWLYKQRTFDVSDYKLFNAATVNNGTDGADISYTWDGCIEERGTESEDSFSFSSLTGMSPYTWDLDIDSEPDGTDESKWRPLWEELAYRRGTSQYIYNQTSGYDGYKTNGYCPSQAHLFDEMTESEFDAVADSLDPEGSTYLDLGMIWGGRLSSPDGIFASNVNEAPSNGGAVARHLIFLTDGEMQPSYSIYSSYGTEYYDKRVTDNGSSNITSRHTSRFLAVCEAIKAKGIRIWVITFASSLSSDLTNCASDDSSYEADNANELNDAFQEIAKDVGELRITQ